ncbi:glucose-1-phosphate cytidylyltransferase [Kineosphaera limosa]|uniref:Putative glucose-1-phosphate cytidylyltransferase n=1 Tax=Kineosphaera limosa NBRC 100340 TaxID=1184609 RepID=K6XCA4_9MICO|nr:glucose-1-phosphate cytidylyltransferase [Kineosphaera limosa]NYE01768.1 glucose-1-phosphate cytidylyltransferase [Kineosphaera limosa]GAB96434.1 putative glucose-1-phosphate cytidylyltransferase [Kineosphaera limosa NBRC 100340]
MKAVILAGGLGTRLSEETALRPKPMVEVGGYPIMWHIMKTYSAHGIDDFVVCCGYKGEVIKDYFANYAMRHSDVTFDLGKDEMTVHQRSAEDWRVTLVDTGAESMTGGRLRRVREHVGDETFCFTYGDGVTDADISAEIAFHKSEGLQATMMAVQPAGRFGALVLGANETKIESFMEKPAGDGAWINAGYFVLEPSVIDYIDGDDTVFEQGPLRNLAHAGQLNAFKHDGFWQPMDTLRDRNLLETLWNKGTAPWKVWN